MGAVINPVAGRRNPFPGGDRDGMTYQGNQIAVPAGLDPEDTKTVLSVLVGDALNRSSQYLTIRQCGFTIHNTRHR
jgi:hypothetical protein